MASPLSEKMENRVDIVNRKKFRCSSIDDGENNLIERWCFLVCDLFYAFFKSLSLIEKAKIHPVSIRHFDLSDLWSCELFFSFARLTKGKQSFGAKFSISRCKLVFQQQEKTDSCLWDSRKILLLTLRKYFFVQTNLRCHFLTLHHFRLRIGI